MGVGDCAEVRESLEQRLAELFSTQSEGPLYSHIAGCKSCECAYYRILIHGLIDGELAKNKEESLYEHFADCAACLKEYNGIQRTGDILREAWNYLISREDKEFLG